MDIFLLQYDTVQYGNILLGVYLDRQLAVEALEDYASQEDNPTSENFLKIIKVSANDKPCWHFSQPEVQEYFSKPLFSK